MFECVAGGGVGRGRGGEGQGGGERSLAAEEGFNLLQSAASFPPKSGSVECVYTFLAGQGSSCSSACPSPVSPWVSPSLCCLQCVSLSALPHLPQQGHNLGPNFMNSGPDNLSLVITGMAESLFHLSKNRVLTW